MASSSMMTEKHKASIEEMKAQLGEVVDTNRESQATIKAAILNDGVGTIMLHDEKIWSGNIFGRFPPTILVDCVGKGSSGSMGAVVYVGPSVQDGSSDCAWILAWSVPGDGCQKNKIYVETGPSNKYVEGNIKWDEIKTKLENSSNVSYSPPDEVTGAEASAMIDEYGNSPAAAAVFDIFL